MNNTEGEQNASSNLGVVEGSAEAAFKKDTPEVRQVSAPKEKPVQPVVNKPVPQTVPVKSLPPKIAVGTSLSKPEPVLPSQFEKDFQNLIDRTISQGDPISLKILDFMDSYLKDMKPGSALTNFKMDASDKVTTKRMGAVAAQRQLKFFKSLMDVIENTPAEDFKKNWIIILSYFYRYKNEAFGERYVNRFAEFWDTNDDRLKAFQRLVNLITLSANPAERHLAIQRVNLPKTMELEFTESGRNNIGQFYAVATQ